MVVKKLKACKYWIISLFLFTAYTFVDKWAEDILTKAYRNCAQVDSICLDDGSYNLNTVFYDQVKALKKVSYIPTKNRQAQLLLNAYMRSAFRYFCLAYARPDDVYYDIPFFCKRWKFFKNFVAQYPEYAYFDKAYNMICDCPKTNSWELIPSQKLHTILRLDSTEVFK